MEEINRESLKQWFISKGFIVEEVANEWLPHIPDVRYRTYIKPIVDHSYIKISNGFNDYLLFKDALLHEKYYGDRILINISEHKYHTLFIKDNHLYVTQVLVT